MSTTVNNETEYGKYGPWTSVFVVVYVIKAEITDIDGNIDSLIPITIFFPLFCGLR